MSTGLIVYKPESFVAVGGNTDIQAAQDAALATGETFGPEDLINVKTPAGGATKWTIEAAGAQETVDEIVGVLVCWQPTGILWPSDDAAPGTLPVLRTFEPTNPMAVAEQVGPIPDFMLDGLNKHKISDGPPATFRWANLPQNQWGTGKKGIGKACKEQRIMFILREGDLYPLVIRAQPGSLKVVTKWFKQLTQAAKVPYYRCVVSLKLTKQQSKSGQAYSQIVPSLIGTLPSDAGESIYKRYTSVLSKLVRTLDETPEHDGSGE